VRVEPRRRQPGETRLGKRGTIELEERWSNGMETEGIALLEDDTGKLAPDFYDEWFGDGLHHRLNLLLDLRDGHDPTIRQWRRLPNLSVHRANNVRAASIWRSEFFYAGAVVDMTKE